MSLKTDLTSTGPNKTLSMKTTSVKSGSDVNPVDLTIGGEFGKEVFRHLVPEEDL